MKSGKKDTLGVFIVYGPEIRSFIFSGLAESLSRNHNVVIFTTRPESEGFLNLPPEIAVRLIEPSKEPDVLKGIHSLARAIHQEWVRNKYGVEKWKHKIFTGPADANPNGIKKSIASRLSFEWALRCISETESLLGGMLGTDRRWTEIYQELNVKGVIFSEITSRWTRAACQTAHNLGIKTCLIPNSWKDIHVNPHMPVVPCRVLVSSPEQRGTYKRVEPFRISEKQMKETGSLHLAPFDNGSLLLPRQEFMAAAGLKPERPYFCYTAALPDAVVAEEKIIASIAEALHQQRFPGNPQLLLRLNPMEDDQRFDFLKNDSNVVIQKPKWEWFPEKDWCAALRKDLSLWVSSVRHAEFNVSIPSTVTLEFLKSRKRVINVCFDFKEVGEEKSNKRFWRADFYKECHGLTAVSPAFSNSELFDLIEEKLTAPALNENEKMKGAEWMDLDAVRLTIDEVERLCKEK